MMEHRVDELRELLDVLSDPTGVLASLIELSPCALALYEPGGHCIRANPAYRELFGADPDPDAELAEDLVLGRSGVLFWLRRAFGGETVTTPTFWYEPERSSSGRGRVALSARAFPLRTSDNAIELIAIAFRDETDSFLLAERRRNEEEEEPRSLRDEIERAGLERRTSEEQFRAIFEKCADGVMLTDDAGRVLDINPSGCRILGRRVQDIVGSRYWEHLDDTEHSVVEGVVHAKACVWRADGQLRDLEMRSVADFLPHRHLTTFADVTERNHSLRRLEQNQRHLAASQRVGGIGSWQIELRRSDDGPELSVIEFSDECFRLFGIEPGSRDMKIEQALALLHPDERAGFLAGMRRAASTRELYTAEHRLAQPDGTIRRVRIRAQATDVDAGSMWIRWIGTAQQAETSGMVDERMPARIPARMSRQMRGELEAFARAVWSGLDDSDPTGEAAADATRTVHRHLLASHASRAAKRRMHDSSRPSLHGR